MSDLNRLPNGGFDVRPGAKIRDVAAEAIAIAEKNACPIAFKFPDVIVTVTSGSKPDLIEKAYLRATHSGRRHIGPYPSAVEEEPLNLDKLNSAVSTVYRLLQDRHPGLISWQMGLQEHLKKLHDILSQAFDTD